MKAGERRQRLRHRPGDAPSSADPIFELIDAHRMAALALSTAANMKQHSDEERLSGKMRSSDLGYDAVHEALSEAADAEMKALRDVLSCRPKTMEGILALLDWRDDELDEVYDFSRALADVLRNIIARGRP
jgi:hypothetical protein